MKIIDDFVDSRYEKETHRSVLNLCNYNKNNGKKGKNNNLDLIISEFKQNIDLYQVAKSLGATIKYDSDKKPKPLIGMDLIVTLSEYIIKIFEDYNIHIYQIGEVEKAPIFIYNGLYWKKIDLKEFQHNIKDISLNIGIKPIKAKNKNFNRNLSEQILYSFYNKEIVDNSQSLINLQNGTLDITTMKLRDFDYRDFLKYQLDYEYNPSAKNELWEKFLNEILPNKDTQRTLQEIIGSIFVRSVKLEYSFFFYGGGSNGKSVVVEVLKDVIGNNNISKLSLSDLDEPHNRTDLNDKLVNISTENSRDLKADVFKKLSSGEAITAKYMYCQPFTMENYAKSIYLVNELNFNNIEHSHGFFRRFLIIPFNVTIPLKKQDRRLHHKILENKSGVLNWIIDGAKRVLENKDLFISKECNDCKIDFIDDVDSAVAFMNNFKENYFNNHTQYKKIYLKDIHNLYLKFCNNNGFKYPIQNKTLSKRLLNITDDLEILKSKDMTGVYFEISTKKD